MSWANEREMSGSLTTPMPQIDEEVVFLQRVQQLLRRWQPVDQPLQSTATR